MIWSSRSDKKYDEGDDYMLLLALLESSEMHWELTWLSLTTCVLVLFIGHSGVGAAAASFFLFASELETDCKF